MLISYLHIVKSAVKRIRKIIRPIKSKEHHLYQIDVQKDEDVINGFAKIGEEVGTIDGVYHSIAFANMEDLRGRFLKHLVKDSYLHKILVHIH